MKILVAGEVLWDVFPDGEHLGGASFNFCAHARRLGHDAVFVSAVGRDARGDKVLRRMEDLGLSTRYVRQVPEAPTGIVSVALDSAGVPRFTIHRPAAYDFAFLSGLDLAALAAWSPDWIYFGTLYQADPRGRLLIDTLLKACPAARRFYDINLRIDSYNRALLEELLPLAGVVKLNEDEVVEIGRLFMAAESGDCSIEAFCRAGARSFEWEAVCVTRGERGCALLLNGRYVESPGYRVEVVDTVGSGDAFSAAFLHAMAAGKTPAEVGDFANRLGALVASRAGGTPEWSLADCEALSR